MPVSIAAYGPRAVIALAVFAFLAMGPAAAEAADPVPVRAADHGDFGRIVFDWNAPTDHSVKVEGRELTVSFDKPMEGSFEQVERRLKDYVSAARLEDGGRKAVFTLNGDFTAAAFESGNSLAIDLRRAAAAGNSAGTARRVAVRAGEHGDFSRIVFDWPGLVDYQASEADRTLTLNFPQSAALDLDAVQRKLPPFVTAIDAKPRGSGVAVTISGVDAARFRHFRSETKVVVDVLPPASPHEHALLPAEGPNSNAGAPVPPPPSGSTNAPQPAPTDAKPPAAQPRHRAMVADLADEAIKAVGNAPVSLLPEKATASPAPPSSASNQSLTSGLKPAAAPAATPPVANIAAPLPAPQNPAAQAAPQPPAAVAAQPSPAAPAAQPSQPAAAAQPPAQPAPPLDAKPVAVTAKAEKGALVMTFGWKDPVGAAVFRRAGALWVVFDRKAPLDLAALESWRKEVAVSEADVAGASALRFSIGPAMSASVRREGTAVSVVLSRSPARLVSAIAPAPAGENSPRLLLPLADARNPIAVPDAEVGDTIVVVPVMAAGEGVATERRYALFHLLATAAGVVVEPKADGVAVKTLPAGVEISSTGGLFLSNKNGAPPAADQAAGATPPSGLPPDQSASAPRVRGGGIAGGRVERSCVCRTSPERGRTEHRHQAFRFRRLDAGQCAL